MKEIHHYHGGFVLAHWCDTAACEDAINKELAVTIRLVPADRAQGPAGACIRCGKPSAGRVLFAKAY